MFGIFRGSMNLGFLWVGSYDVFEGLWEVRVCFSGFIVLCIRFRVVRCERSGSHCFANGVY